VIREAATQPQETPSGEGDSNPETR
jgi:hypothetical protein